VVREQVVFQRSNKGTLNKYYEALKILEFSVMLVELFDLKEFNNIIAGQLRLILCDTSLRRGEVTDNSLIRKINPNPMLFPVNEFMELSEKGNAFIPGDLLDTSKPKITLDEWLNQCVLKINLGNILHEITIFEFIKEAANKSGGAHVDSSLPEKSFIIDVHSERLLCQLAKGLFISLGRDFLKVSEENLSYLINKFKEKASN
jgi:hypothetical protein